MCSDEVGGSLEDIPIDQELKLLLVRRGYNTLEKIIALGPQGVSSELELDPDEAKRLVEECLEHAVGRPRRFDDLLLAWKNLKRFSTGCKALDDVLDGGVESRAVTELAGEFGTGKTQLCHQLAVMVQLSREEGGLGAKALYVDSEGTFRPERIVQMAEHRGVDPKRILKNIIYARAATGSEQVGMLPNLEELVEQEDIGIILVDSLSNNFRAPPSLADVRIALAELSFYLHELLKLAVKRNLVVVVTSQLSARPGDSRLVFGDPYVSMFVAHRLLLEKISGDVRSVSLVFSSRLPLMRCLFRVTPDGIVDAR